MPKPDVRRRDEEGDTIAIIHSYAAGDGNLSFVAADPKTTVARFPGPTEEECRQALPDGWELYANGPNWRARKIQADPDDSTAVENNQTAPDEALHVAVPDGCTHGAASVPTASADYTREMAEKLLEEVQDAQSDFWSKLQRLETLLGFEIDGTQDLEETDLDTIQANPGAPV